MRQLKPNVYIAGAIDWAKVGTSLSYLAAYIVLPAILAMIIFQRKDVLC